TNVGNRPPLPPLPPPPVARAARKATLPGQAPPPPLRMDRGEDDLLDMPTVNREPPTVTGEPGFTEQPTHAGALAEGDDTRFTQQPTQAGPLDFATSPAEDASRLLMQIGEEFVDPSAAPELNDPERSSLLVELGEDFLGRDSVPMGEVSDTDLELDVGSQAPQTLRAALDEQVDTVTGAVAAIQPAATRPKAPLLLDVTPLSLGVETVDGYCERIIRRNSAIPAGQTKMFTTARDQQDTVIVRICQGENRRVSGNQLLGEVVLDGLRPAARGKVQIAVRFMIDADGTLQVRAQDVGTGQQQQIAIKLIGELPDAQIEQLRERHEAKLGS
ncbi:MAG: Hsp70 family protein, partial [Polyangiales bacterium]